MKNNLKVTKNSFILFIAFVFIIVLMGVAVIGSQYNKENRSKAEHPQCGVFNPCGGCGTRGCGGNDFPSCDSCGNVECSFAPRCGNPPTNPPPTNPPPTNPPPTNPPPTNPPPTNPPPTSTPVPPTNTPTPTPPAGATNTPTPTGTAACLDPQHGTRWKGDANCDGKITGLDYIIYLHTSCNPEGAQVCSDLRADFNKDNKVNLTDYNIWRTNAQ